MPAMADRYPRTSLSSPSSSVAQSLGAAERAAPPPPPPPPPSSSSTGGASRPREHHHATVSASRAGTLVCGLIGKFECTRPESADVKVTVNSCRPGDSVLISDKGCPIARGPSPLRSHEPPAAAAAAAVVFRKIGSGNRSECSDKAATMRFGRLAVEGRDGWEKWPGEMLNPEMDANVHRTRVRQRKTVVYSRLCLDGAMFADAAHRNATVHHGDAPMGNGTTNGIGTIGPGSPTTEVIRFPCVERLIELYANIIRQKEAEVQRFMSSIVRVGDKSRLDKDLSSSSSSSSAAAVAVNVVGRQRTDGTDRLYGSELQQGDIRKQQALPASVSLESLPRTKPNSPTANDDDDDDELDAKRAEPSQHTDGSPRTGCTKETDEGWRSSTTQHSPYGSSDEDERVSPAGGGKPGDEGTAMKNRDKVTRSSSSDSALGLDEDLTQQEQQQMIATVGKVRRLTLGVSDIPLRSALLPVPEPSTLPSVAMATTTDHCPQVVRSKMILEAQLIELPLVAGYAPDGAGVEQTGQQQLGCPPSTSVSRRESAQSYVSETGEGVRYVRTPSVVVSDYSDETMCGITLEEIEYFRRHRLRRGSADCESDISAASSCSNLNYCGSSISALEGCEYQCGLRTPERKVSDCSTCSTVSCDEDEGYSVVRAKLANLSLPADSVANAAATPTVERVTCPPVNPVPVPATAGEVDVRVCSKKKVSPTGRRPADGRPVKTSP